MSLPAISRRTFLVGGAASGLLLAGLRCRREEPVETLLRRPVAYRSWEDLYRNQWRWDRIAKGTHLWANCASACAWDLYVRDGIVWREEQTAAYPEGKEGVPDFNPRGCQKGACFTEVMYGPSRIKWPLKRVGPRGSGRWQRVSWDEALGDIAGKLLDVAVGDGPECIVHDLGSHFDNGPSTAGKTRFFHQLGAYMHDTWAELNDLSMGAAVTWGQAHVEGTSDDWFHADLILLWKINPTVTRIPDAHFLWEARYRGAKVVSIAPDYNASSIHSDLWVPVRVGTDAALALSMAQVIVEEERYKPDYLREQTDLPFLVREDTGRFLRGSDRKEGGGDDVFYVWNEERGVPMEARGTRGSRRKTLKLGKHRRPALEGSWEVATPSGPVRVTTVFERLKRVLAGYTPEAASKTCGVSPDLIRTLAREYASAERALILSSWGSNKFFHSDLMIRTRILLAALTGNVGKKGGGFRVLGWFAIEGFEFFAAMRRPGLLGSLEMSSRWDGKWKGLAGWATGRKTYEQVMEEGTESWMKRTRLGPAVLFDYVHGGLSKVSGRKDWGEPGGRDPDQAVREAIDRGWMPLFPSREKHPRVLFTGGSNYLRRVRSYTEAEKTLWPKLDLVVDLNFRVSNTGLHADYILPAAGWYEKVGIKYPVSYVPFVHFGDKAVDPLWESKPEWEIFTLLSKKLEEEARARGVRPFLDGSTGETRDYANFYDTFTMGGRFGPGASEEVLQAILDLSWATRGMKIEELRRKGFLPYRNVGLYTHMAQISSELKDDETLAPSRRFVDGKVPWPTLTGRQQFYIDHPWYLEAGEALPVHKDPVPAGGKGYPLELTGGHTRWSIHTTWRDSPLMLRLQRGEPVVYLHPDDAARRGIRDHARVRVRNDAGSILLKAKLSAAVRPGQAILYHAWEPYMFEGERSTHAIQPSPLKPLHLVGDYGHIHWRFAHCQPGQNDRDTRIDVEPA